MIVKKTDYQTVRQNQNVAIDLHNLHGQSDFHFPIFCLKDLRLSQFFIVSGTIDHIFQGM